LLEHRVRQRLCALLLRRYRRLLSDRLPGWDNGGVVFVADDLGAWLTGLLADAGRRKLTTFVLGTDQERALRSAATTAVQLTADKLRPDDANEAQHLAMVISQVFRETVPGEPLAGRETVLEALQTGLAEQLAVLDDVSLTGTGQSSSDVLGVPGPVLAQKLIAHLLREIVVSGSRGGPLFPLASQLNDDVTHLQVRRLESVVDQRADELLRAIGRLDGARGAAPQTAAKAAMGTGIGRSIEELSDPFALEVHRPIIVNSTTSLPILPRYIRRAHDEQLAHLAERAGRGLSAIAVLVGGSSTGKTRACWETVQLLPPGWKLWHPFDPSGPEAALTGLGKVGPRTVVWLNETQQYLDTPGDTGERVAAALRTLLADQRRAPVLILGTLWPEHWDALTRQDSPRTQARALLDGSVIRVPPAFTGEELQRVLRAAADDPRLAAVSDAPGGQVTQYLAGVPELLARYHNAPRAAQALIHAAMDARRLGHGPVLPYALLAAAAPLYLTDREWDALADGDWLAEALAYTGVPCRGVPGPLTRIRPRPAELAPKYQTTAVLSDSDQCQVSYRLADYLDQFGRRSRADKYPPMGFWAAASHADTSYQAALGNAARRRGLYRQAAQLHKNACGNSASAARRLVEIMREVDPADDRPGLWAAAHSPLDEPFDVGWLLDDLRKSGNNAAVASLLARDPADHVRLDGFSIGFFLNSLREAGDPRQVATLLARDPASSAPLDYPDVVGRLLDALRNVGATEQVTALARRAAAYVSLEEGRVAAGMLAHLQNADTSEQAASLANRIARDAPLVSAYTVASLLDALRKTGAVEQAGTLLGRNPAAQVTLDSPYHVAMLLDSLWDAGATHQTSIMVGRDLATHVRLEQPDAVDDLVRSLLKVGATEQAASLASRAASHPSPDDTFAMANMLESLERAGATQQITTLLDRDPAAHVRLDKPERVARLLRSLRKSDATQQISTLLNRDPAAHAPLDWLYGVTELLDSLREAGATQQITTLLDRNPEDYAPLDNPVSVAHLLDSLRRAGAAEELSAFLSCNPAVHAPATDAFAARILLDSLQAAGAIQQTAVFASRIAVSAALDCDAEDVTAVLESMRKAGATQQATTLARRLSPAGFFALLPEHRESRFRFGRNPDGKPTKSWNWDDLA
jgi:hypothetical protein